MSVGDKYVKLCIGVPSFIIAGLGGITKSPIGEAGLVAGMWIFFCLVAHFVRAKAESTPDYRFRDAETLSHLADTLSSFCKTWQIIGFVYLIMYWCFGGLFYDIADML